MPDLLKATADVATPALVVDVAAAEANIAAMAAALDGGRARLRPHLKAHKCTTLLRRQLADGRSAGVTCATALEAEVVAWSGACDDVLVGNEVADAGALRRLATAAGAPGVRVTTCVDDPRHVELLAATATALGVRFEVLVEVDVGQGRAGVAPESEAVLALARQVEAAQGLTLRGLQGYHGHAVLLPSRAERTRHVAHSAQVLGGLRAALLEAGHPCEVLSGGGTGTYDLDAAAGVLDEIQAGSYVLMDASYGRIGLEVFTQALFCRTTVVSRQGTRLVLDAGLKALSAEYGMPDALAPGVTILGLSDEHATARVAADSPLRVGDAILLVPAHVDPTVNLHGALHAVHADGAVEAWPVDARRP